jgi:signal transduction histidine kinase
MQELTSEEKDLVIKSLKKADRELEIVSFKLDRTEKVKRTTAILLEETIAELEQKRQLVEESNEALEKSLEELKAAQTQLVQSEKMASLGELTAGIAHEIQNPLNFVNNFSEINQELLDEIKEEIANGNLKDVQDIINDLKENEQKISEHGKRADSIVKGMLLHSRTSTGEKVPADLNALCDEYLRLAYHGMRAKDRDFNADFELSLESELPKVEVVPQDIGRVLLNLLNNAFQAIQEKSLAGTQALSGMVKVSTKNLGDQIELTITDNGPGIPDDIKDKIFQPFFTTKPTGQGTGLGLSLAYDIVKAHGGKITVDSQENKGTMFSIILKIES